jgi:hypothetical protein
LGSVAARSQMARDGENLHYILLLRKEQLLRKRNFFGRRLF